MFRRLLSTISWFIALQRERWSRLLHNFVSYNTEHNHKSIAAAGPRMETRGRVVVYSVIGCQHCMRAKNSLQELGLAYTDVSLDSFPKIRDYVKQRTGKTTVPQIFFNNIYVGGNEALQKAIEDKNEIERLIEEVKTKEADPNDPQVPDASEAVDSGPVGEFVCEPDEYAILVTELKASGLVKDHRVGVKVHKRSFSGKEFVKWVMKTKELDHARAMEMGQALVSQHFGHQVSGQTVFQDDDTYYRLLEDDDSTALNAGDTSKCEPRPASELGEEVRRLILKVYSAFLSADGKKVNYKGIAGSSEFDKYKRLTKELMRVQLDNASREEKLAFFVNIYNALVIHANIAYGPPTNMWQRYKFFNTVRYIIGGYAYSLQDIENGVLRANRKGVGMLSKPFGKNDQRLKVALQQHEPLIHFALVCGAKSCPPIKTYSTDGIMDQLRTAAEAFLEGDDSIQFNMSKKEVRLSMIFKWYRQDFGKDNEEVVQFLHNLMPDGDKKNQLGDLLKGKFRVSHMHYDWGVNS